MTHSEILKRWAMFLKLIGVILLPYQQELAEALLLFPETVKLTQCRQSGKSFVIGLVCFFLMYILKWDIVVTAPTLPQTRHIMKHVLRCQDKVRAKFHYSNKYSLSLKRRGSIQCLSGSETANVEGPSADLVIVEEHQDLTMEHVSAAFLPMLSWTDGLLWSCGIGGASGSVAERDDVEFVWSLPYQEVIKVKPGYERLVEAARKEMLPEEFAAHYECQTLDMSAKRLISNMQSYAVKDYEDSLTVVGIDWGKRLDQSVVTVVDKVEKNFFITGWLVPTGSYDEQVLQIVEYLKDDVAYDEIISETNGVGDGCTDMLIKEMGSDGIFVTGLQIDQDWKTEQAKLVHRTSKNGQLKYNKEHELSGACIKDLKKVDYKMLDTDHVKCTHSDFLSSLFCALHTQGVAYL